MAASIRHRFVTGQEKGDFSSVCDDDLKKQQGKQLNFVSQLTWVLIISLHLVIFYFIHLKHYTLPVPKTVKNSKPGEFVEERTRKYLVELTDFGTRPVGSEANEIKAVNYLLQTLNGIKQRSQPVHNMLMDLQKVSGSFSLNLHFLGGYVTAYDNVQNVIVKIGPGGKAPSLLVSCHFDSVLDSPGASDPAVTCCLMLEVLEILVTSDEPLKQNVVFLFNGAEENILQASHGFITQHPWAEDVKAFVNLDAAGAGAREIVFQTGPEHPWLVRLYADNAPHPFASVIGQEVFQSGVVPSDTDYRIYRDFGKIPGLDIAYISNGYVYHTKHDRQEMIQPGCMQRGGENLLALVKALSSSPKLDDPGKEAKGGLVFYDVIGYFVVLYPAQLGFIINGIAVAVALINIATKVMSKKTDQITGPLYIRYFGLAVIVQLLSVVVAVFVGVSVGWCLVTLGAEQTWFTHNMLMVGLFTCPALGAILLLHSLVSRLFNPSLNCWLLEEVFYDAFMFIFCILLLFLTARGINSACLVLMWVVFPTVIRTILPKLTHVNFESSPSMFVLLHILSAFVPLLLFLQISYGFLTLFTPIMGRIGSAAKPDLIIGGLMGVVTACCSVYHTSLVYITRNLKYVILSLCFVTLGTILVALFTPLGFPYSSNIEQPTTQRSFVIHTDTYVHDLSGTEQHKASRLWIMPLDHFGLSALTPVMPELQKAELLPCDTSLPYCGKNYLRPILKMSPKTYTLPAPKLQLSERVNFKLVSHEQTTKNTQRLRFNMTGPNHITVYFTPKRDVSLIKWSLGDGQPKTTNTPEGLMSTYYLYYSYGLRPEHAFSFWIDLEYSDGVDTSKGVIDVGVVTSYYHGKDRFSPQLQEFADSMPDWAVTVAYSSTYDGFVF